jgi:hypothetical protein
MLLFQAIGALIEFCIGLIAQSKLGMLGLVLLTMVVVGIRARHTPLAVTAVTVFTLLMLQA